MPQSQVRKLDAKISVTALGSEPLFAAVRTNVCNAEIVLKNSKNWEARNFGERVIHWQSTPSIWMAVAKTLSGGQGWILADP